jgi:hypothetical protein
MRWDAQRLDLEDPATLPGMPSIRGLLRSVQVPEFPGLTFHEVFTACPGIHKFSWRTGASAPSPTCE